MEKTTPDYMRVALGLARRGLGRVFPNPAVGCVLTQNNEVVGRGWTQPGGRPHAETEAIRRAGSKAKGATAYITLEPCDHHGETPPCSQALIDAGIERAIIATRDPDPRVAGKGIARLKAASVKVEEGMFQEQANHLNQGFFLKVLKKRPLFSLKLATDPKGRIPALGHDSTVTGLLARQYGQMMRARHDGVLFGIGTVLEDDPRYTCRLPGMQKMSPVRLLLDSSIQLSKTSKLMKTLDISPLFVFGNRRGDLPGAEIITPKTAGPGGPVDPLWVAAELARRGLTRVLIEAGPKVAGAFLIAGLVDRISWFKSNKNIPSGIPAVDGFELDALTNGSQFAKTSVLDVGNDILECYDRLG